MAGLTGRIPSVIFSISLDDCTVGPSIIGIHFQRREPGMGIENETDYDMSERGDRGRDSSCHPDKLGIIDGFS
jgi:hypothetical protein